MGRFFCGVRLFTLSRESLSFYGILLSQIGFHQRLLRLAVKSDHLNLHLQNNVFFFIPIQKRIEVDIPNRFLIEIESALDLGRAYVVFNPTIINRFPNKYRGRYRCSKSITKRNRIYYVFPWSFNDNRLTHNLACCRCNQFKRSGSLNKE